MNEPLKFNIDDRKSTALFILNALDADTAYEDKDIPDDLSSDLDVMNFLFKFECIKNATVGADGLSEKQLIGGLVDLATMRHKAFLLTQTELFKEVNKSLDFHEKRIKEHREYYDLMIPVLRDLNQKYFVTKYYDLDVLQVLVNHLQTKHACVLIGPIQCSDSESGTLFFATLEVPEDSFRTMLF